MGEYEGEVRDHFYSCNAGVSVASILVDGSISACPSIRTHYFKQGNIYKDNFMDVWENNLHNSGTANGQRKENVQNVISSVCEGNGLHLRDEEGE